MLKMVCMRLTVRQQRQTKVFLYITAYGEKTFKTDFNCSKYNKINKCHSDMQKNVLYKKWYEYYNYFVYRLTQKLFFSMGEIF